MNFKIKKYTRRSIIEESHQNRYLYIGYNIHKKNSFITSLPSLNTIKFLLA